MAVTAPENQSRLFPDKLIFFAEGGEFFLPPVGGQFDKPIYLIKQFPELGFMEFSNPVRYGPGSGFGGKEEPCVMRGAEAVGGAKDLPELLLFPALSGGIGEETQVLLFNTILLGADGTAALWTPGLALFESGDPVFKYIPAQNRHREAIPKGNQILRMEAAEAA